MKLLFALLLLSTACLGGGGNYLPPEPAPGVNVRTVREVREYTSILNWRSTPWYRTSDESALLAGPVFLLVASTGEACLVPASIWAVTHDGQRRDCPAGWRIAR